MCVQLLEFVFMNKYDIKWQSEFFFEFRGKFCPVWLTSALSHDGIRENKQEVSLRKCGCQGNLCRHKNKGWVGFRTFGRYPIYTEKIATASQIRCTKTKYGLWWIEK